MVRVDPHAWSAMLADFTELAAELLVVDWAGQGRPVIARRPACGDLATGQVPLGLPLPPAQERRRLMLRLPVEGLTSAVPPPLLRDAAIQAPMLWRPTIAAILALDDTVRCFGSIAWQYLTKLPYITQASDLDLLWTVKSARQADLFAAQISAIAGRAPMRIDGEFVTGAGLAVQWSEWESPAADLVVKSTEWVSLLARADLFA